MLSLTAPETERFMPTVRHKTYNIINGKRTIRNAYLLLVKCENVNRQNPALEKHPSFPTLTTLKSRTS